MLNGLTKDGQVGAIIGLAALALAILLGWITELTWATTADGTHWIEKHPSSIRTDLFCAILFTVFLVLGLCICIRQVVKDKASSADQHEGPKSTPAALPPKTSETKASAMVPPKASQATSSTSTPGSPRSCFISYAHNDNSFASKLHDDLTARGISCWKDDVDLKGGDYRRVQVDDAIRAKDKTIIICSKASISQTSVVREILKAMEIQRQDKVMKLFPIQIDDFISSEEFTRFAEQQVTTGEWAYDWLPKIRAFYIPDFSGWEDNTLYAKALGKLLSDLKKN